MATFTYDTRVNTGGNPNTSSGSGRIKASILLSTINDAASLTIPQYSTITSAKVTVYYKETTNKVGNADLYVDFANSSANSVKELHYGDGVVPKNNPSNHSSKEIDIKDYVSSGNANAGHISYSGADRFMVSFQSSLVSRTYSYYCVFSIDYTPHTCSWNSGTVTKAATCTATGVKTYTCTVCGATKTETIAALGHSYGTPTYTWSADGKTCTAKRVCSTNSSHTETATATITSAVKTAATCTAKGTTRYTAKFSVSWASTQTKDVQDIAAKGHTWVAATCTTPKTCSVCGATEGSALGHSYTSKVTAPTETSHGYTRHTCTRCGHYYDDSYTYLVRWFNEDGSVLLETDSAVPYGDMPTYNGATPTKTATAQYSYTHIGWAISPTAEGTTGLTAVVANIDYYARFRADINKYTVTWKNDDGTVLETDTLVPYGNLPDYNGETPTKASTAQYDYTFLGWSAKVNDPPLDEGNLPTVSGNITYTAVYLPVVRKYDLNIVAYDCTVEGAVNGTYDYGTEFTITVDPDFGYKFVRITDVEYDTEYTDNTLMFILTGDTTLHCVCERLPAPIFASPEQQVKDIYIVPALNTIVYVIDGVLPTLKTTMHTVDDLHFSVINIDIDSSKYADYQYYPIEQWYVNDKDGNSTRVW